MSHQTSIVNLHALPRHAIVMETLKGFPNLPAMVRAEQSSAAPHAKTRRAAADLSVADGT
jgi:hypothetical protein